MNYYFLLGLIIGNTLPILAVVLIDILKRLRLRYLSRQKLKWGYFGWYLDS